MKCSSIWMALLTISQTWIEQGGLSRQWYNVHVHAKSQCRASSAMADKQVHLCATGR
jgi:hypothetical protein